SLPCLPLSTVARTREKRSDPDMESRRKEVPMGLTQQEALDLFASDDLMSIGMAANALRKKKNDPRVATYQIDRNINYTNFCTEYCSFCAFYRPLGSKEGYLLSFESIYKK